MGLLEKIAPWVQKAEQEFEHLEQIVVQDAKYLYEKAHQEALVANQEVVRLKALLQDALVKSRDLHQAAINAAQEASKVAEAEFNKLKQAVAAHTADFNTQHSQIVGSTSQVSSNISEKSS